MNSITYVINEYVGNQGSKSGTPGFTTYKNEKVPEIRIEDCLLVK
jgi:hypothetical protein